ncbi:VOC family protein [Segetibacter sp. 3557_3]|uniref:VOC family protein n=1 Tax=Segetibacter sp. 3557_3 TaxID=2547429 RepID=UPI001058E46C|nr:VOC family protein [Segetibacter sp. 3557_3]TDH21258.1 VOC family protein [Segetibacter sp. 3557_3]
MPTINPYLHFNGNAEAAFNFYRSVFGGEFKMMSRFKDAPSQTQLHAGEAEKILHVSLPIGNGNLLMGSDVPQAFGEVTFGTNFNISISTFDEPETDRVFAALSDGGTLNMPLEKTFWGAYFGMCKDKFGVQWMVSYESNQPG